MMMTMNQAKDSILKDIPGTLKRYQSHAETNTPFTLSLPSSSSSSFPSTTQFQSSFSSSPFSSSLFSSTSDPSTTTHSLPGGFQGSATLIPSDFSLASQKSFPFGPPVGSSAPPPPLPYPNQINSFLSSSKQTPFESAFGTSKGTQRNPEVLEINELESALLDPKYKDAFLAPAFTYKEIPEIEPPLSIR